MVLGTRAGRSTTLHGGGAAPLVDEVLGRVEVAVDARAVLLRAAAYHLAQQDLAEARRRIRVEVPAVLVAVAVAGVPVMELQGAAQE